MLLYRLPRFGTCQRKVQWGEHLPGLNAPLRIVIEYSPQPAHIHMRSLALSLCKCLQVQHWSDTANPRAPWMKGCISLRHCLWPGTNRGDWAHWSWAKSLLKCGNAGHNRPNRLFLCRGGSAGAESAVRLDSAFPLLYLSGWFELGSCPLSCTLTLWLQECL